MAIGKSLVGTGLASFSGLSGLGSLGTTSCATAGARAFQTALNMTGASLAVDGIVGPLTISAMQQYQRQAGISVTAQPNERTLLALGIGPAHHAGIMTSYSCYSGASATGQPTTSGATEGQTAANILQPSPIQGGGITDKSSIQGEAYQTPTTGISANLMQSIGQILGGGPQVLGLSMVQWGMLGGLGVLTIVLLKKYADSQAKGK